MALNGIKGMTSVTPAAWSCWTMNGAAEPVAAVSEAPAGMVLDWNGPERSPGAV